MDLFDFFIQAIGQERDMHPPVELGPAVDGSGFGTEAELAEAPADAAGRTLEAVTLVEEGDRLH